jgi:hypothetical protein
MIAWLWAHPYWIGLWTGVWFGFAAGYATASWWTTRMHVRLLQEHAKGLT